MAEFFINRPIFASVISIVIVLAGLISLLGLPIAQFPEITPPQVEVKATYTGASAEVVEQTVATPIEQEVNGVDDMIYMSSQSSNDGVMVLTGDIRGGVGHRPRHRQHSEPGDHCTAEVAARGPSIRSHDEEKVLQPVDGSDFEFH